MEYKWWNSDILKWSLSLSSIQMHTRIYFFKFVGIMEFFCVFLPLCDIFHHHLIWVCKASIRDVLSFLQGPGLQVQWTSSRCNGAPWNHISVSTQVGGLKSDKKSQRLYNFSLNYTILYFKCLILRDKCNIYQTSYCLRIEKDLKFWTLAAFSIFHSYSYSPQTYSSYICT